MTANSNAPIYRAQVPATTTGADSPASLAAAYIAVRSHTEALAAFLSPEDQCVQSMPDASPAKWHRAHTTWFFETFVAMPHIQGYKPFDPRFGFLFNSYYETVGARHPRPARGLLTRPSAGEVGTYRQAVDAALLGGMDAATPETARLIELGLQHEQQHQELLLTDMMHAFAQSPLAPPVIPGWQEPESAPGPTRFVSLPGGISAIGHRNADGFCFDNELPRTGYCSRPVSLPRAWCATGNTRPSWRMAAIARPHSGWRTVGTNYAGKAGTPPCTGAA